MNVIRLSTIIILFVSLLGYLSCQKNDPTGPDIDGGSLVVKLTFPESQNTHLDKQAADEIKIQVLVTSTAYNKVAEAELVDVGDAYKGTIIVPKGDDYIVSVNYFVDDKLVYFGVRRNIKIKNSSAQMVEITLNDPDEMVFVSSGEFFMGNEDGLDNAQPVHSVHIDGFYIDKYEVTNAQFTRFLNEAYSNGYIQCTASGDISKDGIPLVRKDYYYGYKLHQYHFDNGKFVVVPYKESNPVAFVTWYGARCYAEYYGKELPTEAQWEYAARGGEQSHYYDYSGSNNWLDVGWFKVSSIDSHCLTRPVGHLDPNELGIHDMSGNLSEWCSDWYNADYYNSSPFYNPQGPEEGRSKVLRGGNWYDKYRESQMGEEDYSVFHVTYRSATGPSSGTQYWGFRCIKNDL